MTKPFTQFLQHSGAINVAVCACVMLLFLTGCAAIPYKSTQSVAAPPEMTVAEAVRIAAGAMRNLDIWPTQQNETAGFISGEQTRKLYFGMESMSFRLDVQIKHDLSGDLLLEMQSSVSENIAWTDEMDDIVRDFLTEFKKLVAATARQAPAPPGAPATPAPAAPAPAPAEQIYDL